MSAILRAIAGYCFLILVVRAVGRRPGKQLAPFEFVLIFYLGGLALTAIAGDERSFTNAACQIIAIALSHDAISWARAKSPRFARLVDGTPLILLERGSWRAKTLKQMHIQDVDVMSAARDKGVAALTQIEQAILERNGEISILSTKPGN
jgi:uncharacterized membrane protein YcaP (DUF421 family)